MFLAIPYTAAIMVVCLAQSMVQRSGRWLLLSPTALALVYTRGAGGTPSPSVAQPSTSQDKIRTEDDLPRIKTREMLYRLYVQGYYKRLHELQVQEKGKCVLSKRGFLCFLWYSRWLAANIYPSLCFGYCTFPISYCVFLIFTNKLKHEIRVSQG